MNDPSSSSSCTSRVIPVVNNRKVSRKVSARIAADVRRRLLQRYACLDSSGHRSQGSRPSSPVSTSAPNTSATRLQAFERRRVRITTSRMAALSRKRRDLQAAADMPPPLLATPPGSQATPSQPATRTADARHGYFSRPTSTSETVAASPGSLSSQKSSTSDSCSSSAIDNSLDEFEASLRQLIEQSFREDAEAVAEVCGHSQPDVDGDTSDNSTASLVDQVIDIVGDLVKEDGEQVFDEQEEIEQEEKQAGCDVDGDVSMEAVEEYRSKYEADDADVSMQDVSNPITALDNRKNKTIQPAYTPSDYNQNMSHRRSPGDTPSDSSSPKMSPIPGPMCSLTPPYDDAASSPSIVELDSTLDMSTLVRENMSAALDSTPTYHAHHHHHRDNRNTRNTLQRSTPHQHTPDAHISCLIDDLVSANVSTTKRRHSTAKPDHGTAKRVCSPDLLPDGKLLGVDAGDCHVVDSPATVANDSVANDNNKSSTPRVLVDCPTISINQRLAALNQHSEQAWRSKVKRSPSDISPRRRHQGDEVQPPLDGASGAAKGAVSSLAKELKAKLNERPKSIHVDSLLNNLRNNDATNNNLHKTTPPEDSDNSCDSCPSSYDSAHSSAEHAPNSKSGKIIGSIANRMSCLEGSQGSWKNRVSSKDAQQFTIEAKMKREGVANIKDSPVIRRNHLTRDDLKPRPHSVAVGDSLKSRLADTLTFVPASTQRPSNLLKSSSMESTTTEPTSTPTTSTTATTPAPTAATSATTTTTSSSTTAASDLVNDVEMKATPISLRHRPKSEFVPVIVPSFVVPSSHDLEMVSSSNCVELPSLDENDVVSCFFKTEHKVVTCDGVKASEDDLNHIFMESNDILITKRRPTPRRTQRPASCMNPLRNLNSRDDLCTAYTEHRTNVAEMELSRTKREKVIGHRVTMAESSLAGLASSEDFASVTLKKRDTFNQPANTGGLKWQPFNSKMLLLVKGRRRCQARLVAPQVDESFNSGDCYILVTSREIYVWIGKFANVLEKAKVSELATYIYQNKDLGTKSTREPRILKEGGATAALDFWNLIGGRADQVKCTGGSDEDEVYEMCLEKMTRVHMLTDDDQLLALPQYTGVPLVHAMLNSKQCLVFDFGAEMYLWTGKEVPFDRKKLAMSLTNDLWEKGYDYSDFQMNPFAPLQETCVFPSKSKSRPSWCLLGKVSENMETVLFREKFTDWPDQTGGAVAVGGATSVKLVLPGNQSQASKIETLSTPSPESISELVYPDTSPVSLKLEGSDVGRGNKWQCVEDGITRKYDITTLGVDTWHVISSSSSSSSTSATDDSPPSSPLSSPDCTDGSGRVHLAPESSGQFHSADAYVVRWRYRKEQVGVRNLKGVETPRKQKTGRDRCAYFFWQGSQSGVSEKGASALMTVELDEERGPQIRVPQGKEPACFMNLFHKSPPQEGNESSKNVMIIHKGHRDRSLEPEETTMSSRRRLYAVSGILSTEAHLIEITCETGQLRSRGAFVALNARTGSAILWLGCKAADELCKSAQDIVDRLEIRVPDELRLHDRATFNCDTEREGNESSAFWTIVGGGRNKRDRCSYDSLLSSSSSSSSSAATVSCAEGEPRLFNVSSMSGEFVVAEVKSQYRNSGFHCALQFEQEDVYSSAQCSICMLDCGDVFYVWCGWWPSTPPEGRDSDDLNLVTGSAHVRFTSDRLTALQTALTYCKDKARATSSPEMPAFLVYAGLEPLSFTNRFLRWTVNEEARQINLKEGRIADDLCPVDEVLERLQCTRYSLSRLQQRPLPDGVEPMRIEYYLNNEEFKKTLKMTHEEFDELPSWKQTQLKRECGLY